MTHTLTPDEVYIYLNGERLVYPNDLNILVNLGLTDRCLCGEESDYGCHGIKDGKAYSEFYCKECYNRRS
jgi:hypothetical protein